LLLCAGGGTIDFGWITADVAKVIERQPGPIRLQQGIAGPKGFGNLYVEAYPRVQNTGKQGLISTHAVSGPTARHCRQAFFFLAAVNLLFIFGE
jgi:hypothetical protein